MRNCILRKPLFSSNKLLSNNAKLDSRYTRGFTDRNNDFDPLIDKETTRAPGGYTREEGRSEMAKLRKGALPPKGHSAHWSEKVFGP